MQRPPEDWLSEVGSTELGGTLADAFRKHFVCGTPQCAALLRPAITREAGVRSSTQPEPPQPTTEED